MTFMPNRSLQAYKRQNLLFWLLLAGLLALNICALIFSSPFFSVIALIYYALLCWWVIDAMPAAFILMLWFVFVRFTMMISGVAIEYGGYMPEILTQGEPTGAFVRLAGILTVGIIGLALILHKGMKLLKPVDETMLTRKARDGRWWIYGLLGIITIICLFAFFIGMQNGFPLLTGMDRMLYWHTVDNRFLFFFLGNRAIMALFLGLIYAIGTQNMRITAAALTIGLFLISFLFAEKFTSIVIMAFSFITPIFILKTQYQATLGRRLVQIGLLLCLITIPVILTVYGAFDDKGAAIERLQERATSQAQLWYYADQNADEVFRFDTDRVMYNIKAALSLDPENISDTPPYTGVKDFMAETMEIDRLQHYRERGVTLTMATEGYLLKMFGWGGMIIPYLLILAVHGVYLLYLYFGLITVNPLRIILASKLLVWSNYGLNQGYIWSVIGLKPILLLAFIFILELTLRMMLTRQRKVAPV